MLSQEQVGQIKKQLIDEIKAKFPEDKKNQAISQIEAMNSEQLEQFLIQNNLVKTGRDIAHGAELNKEQRCIFCSIISGDINSYKIDENNQAVAILEINPISKAHILIIPKEHISEAKKIPKQAFTLAKKIEKKIKTKFSPKEILISPLCIMEHCIINVLPVYEKEDLNSERHQTTPEELLEIQKFLAVKRKTKTERIRKPKIKKIEEKETKKLWLPKRIP